MSRLQRLLATAGAIDEDQFDGYVAGRVLLCDADSTVYVAAATTKNIETAKTRFCSGVLTAKFLANAQSVRIELTAAECKKAGRYKLRGVKLYQSNRDKDRKPGLVEPLRKAIGRNMFNIPDGEDWYVHLNFDVEADDTLIMDAWTLGLEHAVIYSADKDLRCWPGRFLDPYDNKVLEPCKGIGTLWWHETKSDKSLIGHGPIFFWAQMLMGDSADAIAGLVKCGKQRAWDLLGSYQETEDESAVAELVLREYMAKDQNPWPEAVALWLLRTPEYTFAAHLNTLTLSKELRVWLHKKLMEKWYEESDWRDTAAPTEECDGLSLPTL